MDTATRWLLRSFWRLSPPPIRPPTSPSPASLLQHSPVPQPSQSTGAPPLRRAILVDMLCFVSASAAVVLLGLEDVESPPTSPHSVDPATLLLLDWDNGYNRDRPPTRPRVERDKRPVTDALIALNLITTTSLEKANFGASLHRLFFMGVYIIHITMNMLALDDIGSLMEEVNGPARFLAIYCTSALAGSLMSYRFTPENSVGASDAICGLMGAQGVYKWRRRESLTSARDTLMEIRNIILLSLALSLALRLIKVRIDNWAHLGGFLGGAVVELLLGPHEKHHVSHVVTTALQDEESVMPPNEH